MAFTTYTLNDGAQLFAAPFAPKCFVAPPWGNDKFDCFAVNCCDSLDENVLNDLAFELVTANTDWVESFGPYCEELHDLIDRKSVEIGRQTRVGDGSPMTAWHTNIFENDAIAKYVVLGGHGFQYIKVLTVIGSALDVAAILRLIKIRDCDE